MILIAMESLARARIAEERALPEALSGVFAGRAESQANPQGSILRAVEKTKF